MVKVSRHSTHGIIVRVYERVPIEVIIVQQCQRCKQRIWVDGCKDDVVEIVNFSSGLTITWNGDICWNCVCQIRISNELYQDIKSYFVKNSLRLAELQQEHR